MGLFSKGDREGKKMPVSQIANAQTLSNSKMEFTMENAQEIQQNFYKPNTELSNPLPRGWGGVVSESCL